MPIDSTTIQNALSNNSVLQSIALDELYQLTETYPYFAIAQVLLAKKLQQLGHVTYSNELEKAALLYNQKEILFNYITEHNQQPQKIRRNTETDNRSIEEASTLSDDFEEFIEEQIKNKKKTINEWSTTEIDALASNSINSNSFNTTEIFADILLKQGKNNEALKVLRELVLKYPAKSSYFAKKIDKIENHL